MKKYFWILLLVLFLPGLATGLEVPALQGVVNDYAGLISTEAKAKLENDLRAFEQSDSTQVVILTIPSLEGDDLEGFSIRVATTWKIGQRTKDNGVLLLVAKQERKIRIEVGKGLEGVLTDLLSGRIIDLVIKPNFKRGDYSGGFVAGVAAIIDAIRGEFKGDAQRPAAQHKKGAPSFFTLLIFLGILSLFLGSLSRTLGGITGAAGLPLITHLGLLPIGLMALVVLGLIGFGLGFMLPALFSAGRGSSGGGNWFGGGFFGSGGGGWSGGSSDGGFSGGGGDFGGGGASGDW
jgi:uncharacterized protein